MLHNTKWRRELYIFLQGFGDSLFVNIEFVLICYKQKCEEKLKSAIAIKLITNKPEAWFDVKFENP